MNILKKIFIQFIKFLFVSGIGWLIDFGIYIILSTLLNMEIFYVNILSSIPAITFVFLVSTKKIFIENKKKLTIRQKYMIYFIYQFILIFFISLLAQYLYLKLHENNMYFEGLKIVIKILITPITMFINFIVMKYLAEKI